MILARTTNVPFHEKYIIVLDTVRDLDKQTDQHEVGLKKCHVLPYTEL